MTANDLGLRLHNFVIFVLLFLLIKSGCPRQGQSHDARHCNSLNVSFSIFRGDCAVAAISVLRQPREVWKPRLLSRFIEKVPLNIIGNNKQTRF
jgi:hypothetical protein